jgi:hypothetical protein
VPVLRLRAPAACLAAGALVITGCGGGGHAAKTTPTPSARPTAAPVTPPPTFTPQHVKSSLIGAKDIASNVSSEPLFVAGLTQQAAPSCSDSYIDLPGKPKITAREFANRTDIYTGMHYAQLVAVYADPASANQAYGVIHTKVDACPKKEHVPGKKLPNNKFTIEHDNTWTVTDEPVAGWTHVRGFQKHVEPHSTSIYNVFYLVYDYATRGNVVLTSLYVQRGKPSLAGDSVGKKATALLAKQLQKIG